MCMKTGNDLFITDLDVDSCLVNLDMETCEENWVEPAQPDHCQCSLFNC
jgi:hypothetical protein